MIVELTFDIKIEIHFMITGKFPIALMDAIAKQKNDICKNLSPDLRRPDMLVGSRDFEVEGRRFQALFASDQRQVDQSSDTHPLRVIYIDEVQSSESQ